MKKSNIIYIFLLIIIILISINLLPFAYDDAYIHFRIAENFARYFSPYFNVSERVMSTSSFVWTCILALLAKMPFQIPTVVSVLNSVLLILGSFVWSSLLGVVSCQVVPRVLSFTFQIVYIGVLLPSSVGLMETPLALFLLGLSILFITKNISYGWIILAFAIFTRYEIIILAGLFIIIRLFSQKYKNIQGIMLFIITILILSTVIYFFFSTLIPNTIFAKRVVYQISISSVFDTILFSLFPRFQYPFLGFLLGEGFQNRVFNHVSLIWQPLLTIFIGIYIYYLPWKTIIKKTQYRLGISLLVGGVGIAGVYIIEHAFLGDWYLPLFAIPIIFSVFLLFAITKKICSRAMTFLISLIPLSTMILYLYAAFITPSVLSVAPQGARAQRYLEVGSLLYDIYPNARLLSSEIGGLGYSFHGEIIDGIGLITPIALQYHPMDVPEQRSSGNTGAIPALLVKDESPELIVSYPAFVEEFEKSSYVNMYEKIPIPAFSQFYSDRINSDSIWGDHELYLYIRNDITSEEIISFIKNKLSY